MVRYIGAAEFAEGIWLGVEMRKPGMVAIKMCSVSIVLGWLTQSVWPHYVTIGFFSFVHESRAPVKWFVNSKATHLRIADLFFNMALATFVGFFRCKFEALRAFSGDAFLPTKCTPSFRTLSFSLNSGYKHRIIVNGNLQLQCYRKCIAILIATRSVLMWIYKQCSFVIVIFVFLWLIFFFSLFFFFYAVGKNDGSVGGKKYFAWLVHLSFIIVPFQRGFVAFQSSQCSHYVVDDRAVLLYCG